MNEYWSNGEGRLILRCTSHSYQFSDIMLVLFCIHLRGGDTLRN